MCETEQNHWKLKDDSVHWHFVANVPFMMPLWELLTVPSFPSLKVIPEISQ